MTSPLIVRRLRQNVKGLKEKVLISLVNLKLFSFSIKLIHYLLVLGFRKDNVELVPFSV
jgi:hypothetical protein